MGSQLLSLGVYGVSGVPPREPAGGWQCGRGDGSALARLGSSQRLARPAGHAFMPETRNPKPQTRNPKPETLISERLARRAGDVGCI